MKYTITVIFILLVGICFSQTGTPNPVTAPALNFTDSVQKKQGYWIITGKMKPQQSIYLPDQVMEEGYYKDNRKTGLWKEYYPNNALKNELYFVDGRPNGKMILYHDNGQKSEEGTWKNNRWEGSYTSYDKNGAIIEQKIITYNKEGKELH